MRRRILVRGGGYLLTLQQQDLGATAFFTRRADLVVRTYEVKET
jgi:hypothetical protein